MIPLLAYSEDAVVKDAIESVVSGESLVITAYIELGNEDCFRPYTKAVKSGDDILLDGVKHCVPYMLKAGGGSFVGMSSLAGHVTHRFFGAYGVSKAGIEAMMQNAADEFGSQKIRFNAIRPGFIATEIMQGIPRDSKVYASYVENTPMGGVGEPEDVGHLARFLIGPESRWITGQVISVDGGNGLRRGPVRSG